MAVQKLTDSVSLVATASMAALQFYPVKGDIANTDQFVVAGAGEQIIGICQDNSIAGVVCQIGTAGESKGVAGAAFLQFADLTPDATGRLVTATTGDYVCGWALLAATAAGEIATVYLNGTHVSP
jgi:hypothetical protein